MKSETSPGADSELRDRILAGIAASAELELRFRQPLERFLVGLCDRADGRSQEKSIEIAGQILAECFSKSPSLLERWQGPDNMEAFLRTAAKNRLKSWWTSADKKRTEVNSDSRSLSNAESSDTGTDYDELKLAEHALRAGITAARKACPEGLVFLRLKGLHGVDQRAISRCWGHHEAQTSRRIKEAMDIIRTTAADQAARTGCEIPIRILQQALQRDPSILFGEAKSRDTGGDTAPLMRLVNGGDAKAKAEAVALVCDNAQMLEFLAQILNRRDGQEALLVKDPALSGMAARVTECLRRSLEILQPSEAAGFVTPLMSSSFVGALTHIGADGGTLWMLCPGEAALEAVFNPLEPEIAGKRQPLASGIVSLVLATGEAACVSGLATHARHSPAIDLRLGKNTQAMIAVPFILAGSTRGVLTAVRLTRKEAFGDWETAIVCQQAGILAGLMIQNLTERIIA